MRKMAVAMKMRPQLLVVSHCAHLAPFCCLVFPEQAEQPPPPHHTYCQVAAHQHHLLVCSAERLQVNLQGRSVGLICFLLTCYYLLLPNLS